MSALRLRPGRGGLIADAIRTSEGGCVVLRSRLVPTPASGQWLLDLLVGQVPQVSWAAAGRLPSGFSTTEQFALLPTSGDRTFLVSLASRAATISALTSYNALRTPRRRLARRALALGLMAGQADRLLASRVDVGTSAGAGLGGSDYLIGDRLRTLFGRDELCIAVGGGSGPYRKPVLQVFAADGRPLGYVKVGWNEWSRDSVRREADALRACAGRPMRLGVPALLDHGQWRGLDIVTTAPLPANARRVAGRPRLPATGLLREITELSPGQVSDLAASRWWQQVRTRIAALGERAGTESWLSAVADRLEGSHADAVLAFGAWHGDLVPWNLARSGSRTYAWDWESSSLDAPVGLDALHFFFQVAFVERGVPLGQAAAYAAAQARPALRELGVADHAHSLLAVAHLLELALRHDEASACTGDRDERFFPAITRLLGTPAPDSVELSR
jgi:hypothetical protein